MTIVSGGKDRSLPKLVDWPKHLCRPSDLVQALRHKTDRILLTKSPVYSKIVLQIVGSWAYLLAHVLNKTTITNSDTFNQELRNLERQTSANKDSCRKHVTEAPLLTFSNHISCIDDPVLWGSLFPFSYYSRNTDTVRWTAAAVDICFTKPWHSTFFSLGKTFPIVRGQGVNQPAMEFASALLRYNQWIHLFPEGKVMRDYHQQPLSNKARGYMFKWGISKLIMDFFKDTQCSKGKLIRILPFYHLGLDEILPIGWPYVPRFGKKITILIRPSTIEMDYVLFKSIIESSNLSTLVNSSRFSREELDRIKLTKFLEGELEGLRDPATQMHSDGITRPAS